MQDDSTLKALLENYGSHYVKSVYIGGQGEHRAPRTAASLHSCEHHAGCRMCTVHTSVRTAWHGGCPATLPGGHAVAHLELQREEPLWHWKGTLTVTCTHSCLSAAAVLDNTPGTRIVVPSAVEVPIIGGGPGPSSIDCSAWRQMLEAAASSGARPGLRAPPAFSPCSTPHS